MPFPVTVLTRRGVTVPFFDVPSGSTIPAGEWVALDLVCPPITYARPGDVMAVHSKPDNGSTSSMYIRGVKLQDVIAWLPEHAVTLTTVHKLQTTTLVRPELLSRLLPAHTSTRAQWDPKDACRPLFFRSSAEFSAIPEAPPELSGLSVLVSAKLDAICRE